MISDYAVGRYGWVMTTAFLALSCGNLMLLLGLARIGPSSVVARHTSAGYRLYRLGGHGDLPDGPGRGAIDSHGRHPHDELPRKRGKHYPRGVLLSVSFGSDPRWHTYRRTALTMAAVVVIAFVLQFLTLHRGAPYGLANRFFVAMLLAWLLTTSIRLRVLARDRASEA